MVVLDEVHPVGEAEGRGDLHLVLRPVLPVPSLPLPGDEVGLRQGRFPGDLRDVVGDAVLIPELRRLELPGRGLVLQPEEDARVHHCLLLQDVRVVLQRDVRLGEDLPVRPPADDRAGPPPGVGLGFQLPHHLALPEGEMVFLPVPEDRHVHVLRGVLGGAGAKPVEAQGVLVALPLVLLELASRVHLAEDQLPVVSLLLGVPVHGAARAEVLHLHGAVQEPRDDDGVAASLLGLVDGVGEDLEDRVLAALQPVGAEDDARTLPDPVRSLELADALVAVFGGFLRSCHRFSPTS